MTTPTLPPLPEPFHKESTSFGWPDLWNEDQVRSIQAQARADTLAEQWRPISDPPLNWGSYLVWHEKYGMETLWFQLKDGGLDGRKAGNWYSEDYIEDSYPNNYRVAYWMPLPTAPDSQKKE